VNALDPTAFSPNMGTQVMPAEAGAPASAPPPAAPAPRKSEGRKPAPARPVAEGVTTYERDRAAAGKPPAQEKPGATASKPATDASVEKRRADASRQAASKLAEGDLEWFKDNMAFLKPETRRIYVDAINERLARDGFGNPAMKGKRVTLDPNLPSF
jgi:hypothetical protein